MHRLALTVLAVVAGASLLTGVAGASTFTLGSTTQPGGSTVSACAAGGVFAQSGSDPAGLAATPGGGQITQWQTNTAGETAGAAVTLLALAPQGAGQYRIEAADHETVPSPAGGVATFTPASTMLVSAGDILGLTGDSGAKCFWSAGSTSINDVVQGFVSQTFNPGDAFTSLVSAPAAAVNVSATLVATEDSAVTTTVQPAAVAAGGAAVLASSVTNKGPATNALTFTDIVPAGLKLVQAVSPSGPCTTDGPVVTCTISGLTAGQSTPVDIVVTAAAGKYTNSATVAQAAAVTDPVTTNNKATTTFTAPKPLPTPECVVTGLANQPLATARKLLTALHCRVGKVSKAASGKVAKGDVIKTKPGNGSYAAGRSIAIVESSGPKAKKK